MKAERLYLRKAIVLFEPLLQIYTSHIEVRSTWDDVQGSYYDWRYNFLKAFALNFGIGEENIT